MRRHKPDAGDIDAPAFPHAAAADVAQAIDHLRQLGER
jgi:hypothetical protein